MAFEAFTGRQKVTNEPKVTLLKQGNFNFNNGALKLLKEKGTDYLQLLFDKETNRVAFKPCDKNTQGAYKLRDNKGVGQISGMAFLKHYRIEYKDKTRSFPAAFDEKRQIMVINLGE